MVLTPQKVYSIRDYRSHELVRCEDNTALVMRCQTPCEVKMREAMKAIDRQIQRRMERTRGTDPSRMFLPMPPRVWDLWMDTVRDCVEDGQ